MISCLPGSTLQSNAGEKAAITEGNSLEMRMLTNDQKIRVQEKTQEVTLSVKENASTGNGPLILEKKTPKPAPVVQTAQKIQPAVAPIATPPVIVSGDIPSLITRWALHYGVDPARAIRIAQCESGLNPAANNSNLYYGLFQQSITYWPARAARAGLAGANILDAEANTRVSMMMMAATYNHWPVCSKI